MKTETLQPCLPSCGSARGGMRPGAGLIAMLGSVARRIMQSRSRQVDHQIALILSRSGWRLTDEVERQMMRQVFPQNRRF